MSKTLKKDIKELAEYLGCNEGELLNEFEKIIETHNLKKVDENTSDGYHTFKELYEFRKLYNACFFKELVQRGVPVHKSKRHHDGELCFGGGWFIVMAILPDGQISNHYEMKDWELFPCEEREIADEWDGHTSKDVVERLTKFIKRGWNV